MKRGNLGGKSLWIASFTLTGTIIGAGVLGMPYAISRPGFLIGLFWLVLFGFIILLSHLYLGEVVLRTKTVHHLPGYAKKYLGRWGERLMFFAMIFGIYSALLAYLVGEGKSLSFLFTGAYTYSIYFGIFFWAIMSFLLHEGLRGLKKVEYWGVLGIILIFIVLSVSYLPDIQAGNLLYTEASNFFFPIGVIIFAFLGFTAVPEMRRYKNSGSFMKKAIIIGTLIPAIIYLLFSLVFVGVMGKEVEEIATLSFDKLIVLFGILTMLTSYFGLSFALRDTLIFDDRISRKKAWMITTLSPLLLFLIVKGMNLLSFAEILGIGGVVSGGLTGILVLLMNKKAKKNCDRKPEYSVPLNRLILLCLAFAFIVGVITELIF